MRRGKKSVVCVTQCVAALVLVHRTSSLFSDVCSFLDVSGTSNRLRIQDCQCWPVVHVVIMTCMVRPISCHVASRPWQEPEEELNKLLLTKVSDSDQNVQVNIVGSM